jgi:hypothetical protein
MKNFYKIWRIAALAALLAMPAFAWGGSDFSYDQNPISLEIFPNPVTGERFTVSTSTEISEITIVNILGQQVYDQQFIGETRINIELEIKEKGVYLLQVKTLDGRVATKRILFK